MRAAVSSRYGPPEVVRIAEVPRPRIAGDQVLVRVAVTTVNRTDCGLRAAHPFFVRAFTGLRRPRVHVWGTEFAGTVADVGERVQSFTIGSGAVPQPAPVSPPASRAVMSGRPPKRPLSICHTWASAGRAARAAATFSA